MANASEASVGVHVSPKGRPEGLTPHPLGAAMANASEASVGVHI